MKNSNLPRKNTFTALKNFLTLLFGNALYAAVVEFIIIPAGLVTGGVTGVSIMLSHISFPLNVSYTVFAINIALFILGAVVLGKHFMITTGASTVLYPLFLNLFERVLNKYDIKEKLGIHDDLILCAVFAGIGIGIAVGLVVRIGASTGGSDIPPLVVNKLTGFSIGAGMFITDASIIVLQFFVFDVKHTMYGIIMVIIYSYVINQVSLMGNGKIQINVVTDKSEEVRSAILTELGRGVTFLSAKKGLTGESAQMILTVVYLRQMARAKKVVLSVDPSAFMVISRVSEVNGNGFSFFKGDKKLDKKDVM